MGGMSLFHHELARDLQLSSSGAGGLARVTTNWIYYVQFNL
jgi:hypothetical protein